MRNWFMLALLSTLVGCVSVKTRYSKPMAQVAQRDSLVVISAESEQESIIGYIMKGDTVYASKFRTNAWSGKEEWLIRFKGSLGYVDQKGFPQSWESYGYRSSGSASVDPDRVVSTHYYDPEPYVVSDSLLAILDPESYDTLYVLKSGDTLLVWERSYSLSGQGSGYVVQYKGQSIRLPRTALLTPWEYQSRQFRLSTSSATSTQSSTGSTTGTSGSGHTWQTGKRGGQYYINSKGNKVYKKKK